MKKLFIALILCAMLLQACSSSRVIKRKDCRGVTHYKQKGGFYLSIDNPTGETKTNY